MRVVTALRTESREYSFESSGQGHHSDLALFADDTELMNMLGAVAWSEDPVQVLICDHCGIPQCRQGGCVSFRSVGRFVAVVPSLKAYAAGADGYEQAEFAAPAYIGRKGALLIDQDEWTRLSGALRLPSAASFPSLSWAEALILAQFEGALVVFTLPFATFATLFRDRVLSTDPWLSTEELAKVLAPQEWARAESATRLVPASEAEPITFILDEPFEQITPIARVGDQFGLLLEPDIVIVPT